MAIREYEIEETDHIKVELIGRDLVRIIADKKGQVFQELLGLRTAEAARRALAWYGENDGIRDYVEGVFVSGAHFKCCGEFSIIDGVTGIWFTKRETLHE